ncbi:MAG TPA: AAA family ATPase [Verrucomicrobiae bacterium]|nr:AAA family ATPase [Verrucomicrobiae bacterium]
MRGLIEAGIGGHKTFPNTLLIGSSGSGKRTVVKAAADELKMDFLEVPANGPSGDLITRLVGGRIQAEKQIPPGELGRSEPTIIYLSNFQGVDSNSINQLHGILSTRKYVGADGNRWELTDDIWIIAGMTHPSPQSRIHPAHWLSTAFRNRQTIAPPQTMSEVEEILLCIAQELIRPVAQEVINAEIYRVLTHAPDHLYSLRRWFESAASSAPAGEIITRQKIYDAMIHDVSWILGNLEYRGTMITLDMFQRWLQQFPEQMRGIAVRLVMEIGQKYFINATKYYQALEMLIEDSKIPRGSVVCFCKWQSLGRSSPRTSHDLKNQAKWKIGADIDLEAHDSTWPISEKLEWLVIADDFVGSGGTVGSLIDPKKSRLSLLLKKYPKSKIVVLIVAGFRNGLRQILNQAQRSEGRVKVISNLIFDEEDRCFTATSRILQNPRDRRLLCQFCVTAARSHYKSLPSSPLKNGLFSKSRG